MHNKFLTLVENNIHRYTNGTMLVNDLVKLADNYKSKEEFKCLSDDAKKAIVDFFTSNDLNKRIINIKTYYPTSAPNNEDNRGACFNVEVAAETAPGRENREGSITVPSSLLTVIPQDGANLPPIPDSLRKKERRNFKPVAPEEDEETPNNPYLQTLMSQDGNALTRGDRKLLNKNVTIPSSPAKGMSDPMVKGFAKAYTPLSTSVVS